MIATTTAAPTNAMRVTKRIGVHMPLRPTDLEEERASERRAEQRREERRMEEEYYQRAAEEEYYAQLQAAEEEAYWAEEQWRSQALSGWCP